MLNSKTLCNNLNQMHILIPILNITCLVLPLILAFHGDISPSLPPDTYSYQIFFSNISNSARTAGYPLLLKAAESVFNKNVVIVSIIANAIAILISLFILSTYNKFRMHLNISDQFHPAKSVKLLFLACLYVPSLLFLFFMPLSDFSFSFISASIIICLADLSKARLSIPGFYSDGKVLQASAFLGFAWGMNSLIRPVGIFLPVFMACITISAAILSLTINCRHSNNKKMPRKLEKLGAKLACFNLICLPVVIFFISSSSVSGLYSVYNNYRFGDFNYLNIGMINTKCWRQVNSLDRIKPAEASFLREQCLKGLSSPTMLRTIKSTGISTSYLGIIKTSFLAFLRGLLDSDYISYLSYIGMYNYNSPGPASIDFLYSGDFIGLFAAVSSRIQDNYLVAFACLLLLGLLSSLAFLFVYVRKLFSFKYLSRVPLIYNVSVLYFVVVSTGSDTAGRYYALPLMLVFLSY